MKYDRDKNIIKEALEGISTPQYNIWTAVEKGIKPSQIIKNRRRRFIPIAVCFLLLLSFGVAAAHITAINNFLAIISPEIARKLQPIAIGSEEQGIKMEVVAAMNDDEMAIIYVTLQDLEGNRVDETLTLKEYRLIGGVSYRNEIVQYDDTTKTATLRVEVNGGENLNGRLTTFYIDSFYSDVRTFNGVEINLSSIEIREAKEQEMDSLKMDDLLGGGGNIYQRLREEGSIKILKKDEKNITLPNIDFAVISNVGYIDGRLHVQIKWLRDGEDLGMLYLTDGEGNRLEIAGGKVTYEGKEQQNTKGKGQYDEYIFDLDGLDIDQIRLMGHFINPRNHIKGLWKSTFEMKSIEDEISKEVDLTFDTWTASEIILSPLGVTLLGRGDEGYIEDISVKVNMADGRSKNLKINSFIIKGQKVMIKLIPSLPLDVDAVTSITVEGTTIYFE